MGDVVYMLKVYDDAGCLLPSVLLFRTEAGAYAAAAELIPPGCAYEVVAAELGE